MDLRWLVDRRRMDVRATLGLGEVVCCGAENDFFEIAMMTSFIDEMSRRC